MKHSCCIFVVMMLDLLCIQNYTKIYCYLCVSALFFSFYQLRFSPPPGLHQATV